MGKLKVTVSDGQMAEKLKLEYRKHMLNAHGWWKQLAYDDCWQRDVAPSIAFPSGMVYATFDEAWASTASTYGCEDLEVEVKAVRAPAEDAIKTMEKLKLRLWICSECGTVKAVEDSPNHKPTCDLHSENWPDGEYERSVEMLRSDFTLKACRV
jgi:hypothetical protein